MNENCNPKVSFRNENSVSGCYSLNVAGRRHSTSYYKLTFVSVYRVFCYNIIYINKCTFSVGRKDKNNLYIPTIAPIV